MSWTQEYLDGLGVDRQTITDEDKLTDALEAVVGERFELRTENKSGFLNTYVEGPATGGVQQSLDVPIDDADLESRDPVAVNADGPPDPDDDDIPF